MAKIVVKKPFECGRSCGVILDEGDDAYIVPGQVICPDCARKEGQA